MDTIVQETVVLENEAGLNAETATRFVQIASKYTSKIMISYEDKEVNAKSILSLLAMAIAPDEQFTIKVRGEDEQKALADLLRFIKTGQEQGYNFTGGNLD